MIKVNENVIQVSTITLDATLKSGVLVSLRDKSGREYLQAQAEESPALEILYRGKETVSVTKTKQGTISCYALSDTCAEIRYDALEGNGVLTITEDEATGDLCIEPEVTSARRGVLAARYSIAGISKELRMMAPFYQGIDMDPNDELLVERKWIWPHMWEAGLVIFHDGNEGFWVHCEDNEYRSKALYVAGDNTVAFDTEAWGPVDQSLSAGGIVWRINVFQGGWKVPAARYRDWLWTAYNLSKEEKKRFDWTKDIRLALSWCPTDKALIDDLAKKVDPKTVLLHLPWWRDKIYDQCYPDFTPSVAFKEFLKYAKKLGFRCMPHANSIDMDPSMPEYRYVSDFKYRDIENEAFMGWSLIGMPASNKSLVENRDHNVMVKIHPGLAMWRSLVAENIDKALSQLEYNTDGIFLDVTLCMYNLANSLVDNTTTMQGMQRLIEHVGQIHGGMAVGGEGLNEITMQKLSIGQVHLFDYNLNGEPLERTGKCDLNAFLFGRLCRTIGYSGLSGKNSDEMIRARVHEEHGTIPTIVIGSPDEILNPNPEIARILKQVQS